MTAVLFAIRWYPELKGITSLMIAVTVLCGSVYLLLSTNLGARLGFLAALTGLFGWLTLMGATWWMYGIGLKGPDPSWVGKDVVNGDVSQSALAVAHGIGTDPKWTLVDPSNPTSGQTQAAADDILLNQVKMFTSNTQYVVLNVYSYGGGHFPSTGWKLLDSYIGIFHRPHYAAVIVQPVVPQNTEPGKAPPRAVPDTSKNPITVVMLRDLGARRRPAALICIGSLLIFSQLAWALHRRDRLAMARRGAVALEKV